MALKEAVPQVLNRGTNPPPTGAGTVEGAAGTQPGHTGADQESSWAGAPELVPSFH